MKKNKILLIGFLVSSSVVYAQTAPQGNPPAPNTNARAAAAWYRGGNNLIGNGSNIFGTLWNSPIYTQTAGVNRMKLNGNFSYLINGYNTQHNGYLLLGINNNSLAAGGGSIYTNKGAFSMLHLNGTGSVYQEYGYRPWMDAGITMTANKDLSYIGLRKLSTNPLQEDITETVFLWSDNSGNSDGPDKLVFRFSGYGGNNGTTVSNDRLSNTDLDALHVAQFTGLGLMGLGNTFGTNATGMAAANYIDPKSLFHMSYDWRAGAANQPYGYMQITYRRPNNVATDIFGQGEQVTDGLRFGIDNAVFGVGNERHLNSYLRWQEASSFIIQTEDNAIPSIANNERIRVTSVGALVLNHAASYAGITGPSNATRVAISHDGANPVTKPMSLLHLGYNTGVTPFGSSNLTDGWRNWMDIGTFTGSGTDNMYVGLKREGTDRFDAVVNWGDNQVPNALGQNGPDNLRFIFTSTTTALPPGQGDPISQSNNGLETGRFYPGADTTFTYLNPAGERLFGRFGVGDFTATGVNEDPTHKLDVIGNGRFRYLPDSLYIGDSTVTKYVMVDSMGVLRWTDIAPIGGNFGAECSDTINGKLALDTKVNFDNNSMYFVNPTSALDLYENRLGIGYNCGDTLPAKLSVYHEHDQPVTVHTTAISGINRDTTTFILGEVIGVYGASTRLQYAPLRSLNIGGDFYANNAAQNYGVRTQLRASSVASNTNNFGLFSFVDAPSASGNFGVYSRAGNGIGASYAIFGIAAPLSNSWAGYFNGNTFTSGQISSTNGTVTTSDQMFKTNVDTIANALSLLAQLQPHTYFYDTTSFADFNFESDIQMGLIAQEVELVIPSIISNQIRPAQFDSLGNQILPELAYKGVEYQELIPLLIAGVNKQQEQIASKDSIITDLNNRLTSLENCLSGILPFLCQLSNSAIEQNEEETQEQLRTIIDVQLSNRNSIILNQNVPNPFAESTVITYSVPASVGRAQIHFYDMNGILINSVEITERGEGQLNVYGNDLSSGIYTYSLVADGTVVSTKKMMKN